MDESGLETGASSENERFGQSRCLTSENTRKQLILDENTQWSSKIWRKHAVVVEIGSEHSTSDQNASWQLKTRENVRKWDLVTNNGRKRLGMVVVCQKRVVWMDNRLQQLRTTPSTQKWPKTGGNCSK